MYNQKTTQTFPQSKWAYLQHHDQRRFKESVERETYGHAQNSCQSDTCPLSTSKSRSGREGKTQKPPLTSVYDIERPAKSSESKEVEEANQPWVCSRQWNWQTVVIRADTFLEQNSGSISYLHSGKCHCRQCGGWRGQPAWSDASLVKHHSSQDKQEEKKAVLKVGNNRSNRSNHLICRWYYLVQCND